MRAIGVLALLLLVARAEEASVPPPKAAWEELQAAAGKLGSRERWGFVSKQCSDYLARWQASGGKADGEQAYYLGLFLERESRAAEARDHGPRAPRAGRLAFRNDHDVFWPR